MREEMSKYFGAIGFAKTIETAPGVWEETIIEKNYKGDVLRNTRRYESAEKLNDNVNINNQISILADSFAYENFFSMRYIVWFGSKWKITNIEVQRPRLLLTIGGVYNADNS